MKTTRSIAFGKCFGVLARLRFLLILSRPVRPIGLLFPCHGKIVLAKMADGLFEGVVRVGCCYIMAAG